MLLHMCTVNQDHMMYGSWDIKYKGHGFLSFWASFCPLTLLTTQKIKNFEKIKKPPGDIILHLCTTKDNHMMYSSWDNKIPSNTQLATDIELATYIYPQDIEIQGWRPAKPALPHGEKVPL